MLKECNYSGVSEVSPACFGKLPPDMVWAELDARMKKASG
jgi:hypothetical protein